MEETARMGTQVEDRPHREEADCLVVADLHDGSPFEARKAHAVSRSISALVVYDPLREWLPRSRALPHELEIPQIDLEEP